MKHTTTLFPNLSAPVSRTHVAAPVALGAQGAVTPSDAARVYPITYGQCYILERSYGRNQLEAERICQQAGFPPPSWAQGSSARR